MIAEYGIRAALLADSAIVALIGNRIFPSDSVPQAGTFPVISYQRISTVTRVLLDENEEPEAVRLQLNCLALSHPAALSLAMEIRRLFRGGYSVAGIQMARISGQGDLSREPESKLYGVRIDLLLTMGAAEAA